MGKPVKQARREYGEVCGVMMGYKVPLAERLVLCVCTRPLPLRKHLCEMLGVCERTTTYGLEKARDAGWIKAIWNGHTKAWTLTPAGIAKVEELVGPIRGLMGLHGVEVVGSASEPYPETGGVD